MDTGLLWQGEVASAFIECYRGRDERSGNEAPSHILWHGHLPEQGMLQERIDSLFSQWNTACNPGCAVGIVHKGTLVHSNAYGVQDVDTCVRIDKNTLFDIGSEAKQFTGASVLLLVNSGSLRLENDIHEYVPELPNYGHGVTLRHLAHHTSGLPEYYDAMKAGLFQNRCTASTVLEYLVHQRQLSFPPGDRFCYCNSGYALLSVVVERVAGMRFAQFVNSRLFRPTGMNASFVADEPPCIVPDMARGHEYSHEKGYVHREYRNYAVPGPGSLYSTVQDLSQWASVLQDAESKFFCLGQQMLTPGVLNTGEETRYGFGLDWGQCFTPPDGLHVVTHSGMHAGFRSIILRIPEMSLAVILLCNTRDIDHPKLALSLLNVVLEQQTAIGEV